MELVATNLREDACVPWIHYADGTIVADFENPLPYASVPEVIQIVVVPAGKYTITLPAAPGFVLQVRQHRVVIASGTTSFSFAVGLFVPFASPAWLQGSQPYTAGTLVSVANGTVFSFAFDAAPKGVHALGVSFEAAGVLKMTLNGDEVLYVSDDVASTHREAVVSATALQEKNQLTVELTPRWPAQEAVSLQLVLFPLLSLSEVVPRSMEVTNSFNVGYGRWNEA